MLEFLYTGDYNDGAWAANDTRPLKLHVLIYIMADKYDIPLLGRKAISNFTARAAQEWRARAFADAVEEIYDQDSGTKQLLRDEVIKVCAANASMILWPQPGKDAASGEKIRDIAQNKPCFGFELASAITAAGCGRTKQNGMKISPAEQRYQCPKCTDSFVIISAAEGPVTTIRCPYCGLRRNWEVWDAIYAARGQEAADDLFIHPQVYKY